MKIALTLDPNSKLLKKREADLARVVAVIDHQIRYQVSPCWDRMPAVVDYVPVGQKPLPDAYLITFYDNPDVSGAAGYHDDQGKPYGKIFAEPSFANGSDIFTGDFPLCRVACHEALELWADRAVNVWVDRGDGTEVPLEPCDAVEMDDCQVELKDGTTAPGSNFVHPAFFDIESPNYATKWDHMSSLKAPFKMTSGGYQVVRSLVNGRISQIFGDKYPDWKKALKLHPNSRSGHFLGHK